MKRTKPEYRTSFDTLACTVGPYKLWNIVNEVSDTFNNDLHPQLRNYMNEKRSSIRPPRNYRGPREPRNALRCYMVGLTQYRASPHVAILCKEKWFLTQARHIILESGLLQDRGWVGCIKLTFEIRQNGAASPTPKSAAESSTSRIFTSSRRNQHNVAISYYPESTSGLRIAISGFNGLVRMATLGGMIEINGALFGLSVSHVFSAPTPSYDGTNSEYESDIESLVLDQDDLDPFVRTGDSGEFQDVTEEYAENSRASEPSDKLIGASENEEDVVEPLMGLRLDNETAEWSLGSRETFGNEAAYEFEWALISRDDGDGSFDYHTSINLATSESGEKLPIRSTAYEMVPASTHLILRTPRGEIPATAISSESSVQLTSSKEYLHLWTVRLDRAEEGDCGSWIVNIVTGELFGMLVATCEAVCEAYILPIKDIFKEIEALSGYSPEFPFMDPTTEMKETMSESLGENKPSMVPFPHPARDEWPLEADSIRIMYLLSGMPEDKVHCELSSRSLSDHETYEVLCCVLGPQESTSLIIINGQSVKVNSSLASALQDVRYIDRPRCLWVDTLCIDPWNIKERNSQVPLLTQIMLQARGVCIWLGRGNSASHQVFLDISGSDDRGDFELRRWLIVLDYLFESAWFHRGAVQAICLARDATVHCGRDSMPWKSFVDVVSLLASNTSLMASHSDETYANVSMLSEFVNNIENSVRWLDDGRIERRYTLESLLMAFSSLRTAIPHDAIYSMLSLASDVYPSPKSSVTSSAKDIIDKPPPGKAVHELNITSTVPETAKGLRMPLEGLQRRPFVVDYLKPFGHVCRDLVCLVTQNSQSLDILCTPWAPLSYRDPFWTGREPSWISVMPQAPTVMNRDSQRQAVNARCFARTLRGPGMSRTYDASRAKPPILFILDDPSGGSNIGVRGFTLDIVQKRASSAQKGEIPWGWIQFLGWNDINKPPPDKAWRTLVGDRGKDTRYLPSAVYRKACQRVFKQIVPGNSLKLSQAIRFPDRIIQEFSQTVEAVVSNRRLIRTAKHGFLGLAPNETSQRDIIVILYGLSVPVVLRHIADALEGDNVYTLIGDCFIYGMMDGEALDFKEEQRIKDQIFVLR